jgi:hypothetical protein
MFGAPPPPEPAGTSVTESARPSTASDALTGSSVNESFTTSEKLSCVVPSETRRPHGGRLAWPPSE